MLGAEQAGLNAGRHALAWVLGQTDIWYLLYRCANYVSKGHGHSPSSVSILDNLFTLDEDHFDYSEEEDFNNQFLQGRGAYRRDDPLNRFWSFSRLAVRSHCFTCPLVFKPQPFFLPDNSNSKADFSMRTLFTSYLNRGYCICEKNV
jgi:hypothetical protein